MLIFVSSLNGGLLVTKTGEPNISKILRIGDKGAKSIVFNEL